MGARRRSRRGWRRVDTVRYRGLALAGLLAAGTTPSAAGQAIPFSQHGTVSQRVGLTDIEISYNRPVARGRTLFGPRGVVRFDRIWHPGADSATRIRIGRDVLWEGQPLPRGEYSLWVVPRDGAAWTVILSRASRVFHDPYPGEAQDALRVDVAPEAAAHMETLAFYFPIVARDSTVLRLHWGTTAVPVRIRAPLDPLPR